MAITKGLYAAPEGVTDVPDLMEPEIEIEIENPDSVTIGIDGMEISMTPGEDTAERFDANLVEFMDERDISALAGTLLAEFEKDISDRREWIDTYVEGLKLLGLKYEDRTEPWDGACGVFHPMLTESVVRFQSEAIMETFPAMGPVKTQIVGAIDALKEEAAARVREDMNYQLTEVMTEYRPEHERLLWNLPITGSAFKKVYFDPSRGRQVAMFVPAEDIVVPYGASDIESTPRLTHVMRKTKNEVTKLQSSGFYVDIELGEPATELDDIERQKASEQGFSAVQDDRFRVLEMHVELDLAGFEDVDKNGELTGVALPYVVTIEKGTAEVLAIRRNWHEEDTLHTKRQHFVHYQYIPGFGFYGYGLIHLIGGYAKSATMLVRQLVDAGTLSNLPGGLKTRGLRIVGDDTPIAPGEFRDVDVASGSIKDNVMTLPYKEPSQVLYALFQNIVAEGRAFASSGDMKVADMSANAPVGTTLAILERTLKVMSAVQARLHFAMKQEFKLLKSIIRDYADEDYEYEPVEASMSARKTDYDNVDVIPVSDPNAATMAQKIVQYQAALQLAQGAPQLYDLPLLHRQMIEVLGIKNAAKLIPVEDDKTPVGPVQENQDLLNSKPIKAFIEQDHQAHMAVHQAFLQDPAVAQMIGQSPMGQQVVIAMQAHLAEHTAFEYRQRVEAQLGLALPSEEQTKEMSPEIAAKVAQLMAQAAQQALVQSQAQAAQVAAQQQQQDPVVQMQQAELQIKQMAAQTKQDKAQSDAQLAEKRLAMEAADRADKSELAEKRLAMEAATKADQLDKAARTQRAKEELAEQQLVLDAQRNGVMGRAQEQQILREDRKLAMEAMNRLIDTNKTNSVGDSGRKPDQEQ